MKARLGGRESGFRSFTTKSAVAREKFAGEKRFVTKAEFTKLRELEAAGHIRIWTPDDVRKLLEDSGKKKVADQAKNVQRQMVENFEILIEGVIPEAVLGRLN